MSEARRTLAHDAETRAAALEKLDRARWKELHDDATTDFQRACLEAALIAEHPLPLIHAFADAIRATPDGAIAEAVRPPAGDVDSDPLRAYQRNGNVLTPPVRPFGPSRPLMDLTGGAGPLRYENVLDQAEDGTQFQPMRGAEFMRRAAAESRSRPPAPSYPWRAPASPTSAPPAFDTSDQGARDRPATPAASGGLVTFSDAGSAWGVELLSAAAAAYGIRFIDAHVMGGGMAEALHEAAAGLERGVPIPDLLGGADGVGRRLAVLLQASGEPARRAFQLHDPFANETVWVHRRDLEGGRELPLGDATLRRIVALALPERS